MDDKVQKLLQRAIQENLSPDRVAYIMQFNGYDQSAIDAALSELSKKKRPTVFQKQYESSDTQSQSQQVGPPTPSGKLPTFEPSVPKTEAPELEPTEEKDVEVTTGDWWGNAWNGLVEGVSDFMYAFNKETGATQEQIAEFVELSKEKYPDLYRSYEQNKQSDTYKELGLTEEQIKRQAAANAYIEYWETNPEIENEVVPYIRQRRRELGVERDGVKIDQAVQEKLDQQFLAGAVKGLASSIPAMVTSGVTMGGSFMSTSYYAADENLKSIFAENPDLQMTRGQQEAYKLTVAGIEGVLEKVGLSGALKGNSMVKRALTAKVFSRLAGMTDEIGSEAFERVVKQEAKGLKGYLKKTAQGTLSEAETGALQQLSNDLINQTVNGLSGQEVFQPKDAMTILKDALYAGAQEAVGGGIISGTIGTFSNDIATQEDFDAAEEFIGKVDLVKMEENLNKRVEQGKLTEEKKNNILEAAKGFKDTMAKVPEDMDQASKRQVYQLINKKMQIQNQAAGKDQAIQKKANERVEQINEQIASIYESQVAAQEQAAAAPEVAPEQKVETPETTIEARFHTPEIQLDQKGNAIIDPAKVKEESFTGASVVEKGHVDAETASAINQAVNMLGDAAKGLKVRVFDSVESLLNADQGAANFYAKSGKTPKAYISKDGNEMFVLTKNAVEQYNAAKGTDVEYAKQYVHEIAHPIVSSLVTQDPTVQNRLYNEIKTAAEAGDAVAQRALNFGKNYSMRGEATVENETVVEFLALVTDKKRFESLPRSTKQKIIDFFNSLLNRISSNIVITTDQQLYDLARDMRDAYRMQKGIKVQPTTNKNYQQRSQEFSVDEGTTPGNRLFNAPLEDALTIAEEYMESTGRDYDPGKNFSTLDTELAQEISQAYDNMEHAPRDPEVKKAYNALVKETIDQHEAIIAKGYVVEINNNEPYSSSKDMIEDLRSNKRMKIFSTESGFGDSPITDDQRAENPLLRDSGYKDVNGQTLLVNDVFRFVHDFFGHAKRGNSFGPKGEENAWDAHSRMYSKQARRALTSETRGQNSWVNFSGVNEEAFKLRDKARRLRKEGRTDEASRLVGEVYEMMSFAEQKIGILPDKYVMNPYVEKDVDFSLDEGQTAFGAAPYRAMYIENIKEATDKFSDKGYNKMISDLKAVTEVFGGKVTGVEKTIGGWFDSKLKKVTREISFRPIIEGLNTDDLQALAALTGKRLAVEVQDAVMVITPSETSENFEVEFQATSAKAAEEMMMNFHKEGVNNFTLKPKTNTFVIAAFGEAEVVTLQRSVNNNIKKGLIDQKSVSYVKAEISFPSSEEYGRILEEYKRKRQDEGEVREDLLNVLQEAIDAPSFSVDETVIIREGVDVRFSNVNPDFRKKREMVYAERVLSENKTFDFTGREKIESADDVAFLFRNMEDDASENAFVVFHNADGEYKTIWLNTGLSTSVSISIPRILTAYENAAEALGTKDLKMTFVHNHPSGALKASKGDVEFAKRLNEKIQGTAIDMQDSIIINLDSGKYVTFGLGTETSRISWQAEARPTDIPQKVESFSKQKLYTKSNELTPIFGSASVATMLSKFKRGISEKAGYFILDNQNKVRYVAVIEGDTPAQAKRQAVGVVQDAQRYGNNIVFFGTNKEHLQFLNRYTKNELDEQLTKGEFNVLDIVHIKDSENYIMSSREGGEITKAPRPDTKMIDFSLDEQLANELPAPAVGQFSDPSAILELASFGNSRDLFGTELSVSEFTNKLSKIEPSEFTYADRIASVAWFRYKHSEFESRVAEVNQKLIDGPVKKYGILPIHKSFFRIDGDFNPENFGLKIVPVQPGGIEVRPGLLVTPALDVNMDFKKLEAYRDWKAQSEVKPSEVPGELKNALAQAQTSINKIKNNYKDNKGLPLSLASLREGVYPKPAEGGQTSVSYDPDSPYLYHFTSARLLQKAFSGSDKAIKPYGKQKASSWTSLPFFNDPKYGSLKTNNQQEQIRFSESNVRITIKTDSRNDLIPATMADGAFKGEYEARIPGNVTAADIDTISVIGPVRESELKFINKFAEENNINVASYGDFGFDPVADDVQVSYSLDEEFYVSDEVNTKVESKGTPRLDDISFSLDEKVRRHEGRGKIVRSKLKDFVGKVMHVTFSDRMVGGFVGKEEYLGGVYFPYITNSLWGANSVGAANKIIKAAVKNADGFRYMVIAMMNPDSHMSNLDMSTKALKELENELNSSRVTVEEGYKRIMKAFDKKALKEKFGETVEKYKGKRKTKANLIKLIDETVLSTDATFDLRRSFLETVLGKADKNLKLRFGNLPSYSTLAQMLAEPVTRGMAAGDTSFIVRTKGDLFVAEPKKGDPDYHPSYRYIVRSTEDVELVFLDGIYNVVDMFPRIEAKNLGHKEYQDKYGDNWRMRYLMYMGLGKMSTTVSDEMVEAEAKAAIDFSTDEGIDWYVSPEGKGDPAISRRDNLLEEAAQDLKAGRLKNYEFREMAKALSPIEPITRFFAPATTERMEEALAKNKRPSLNKPVKDGEVVALRLDIPAYTGSNTWVVSIHDGKKRDGKVISYRSVARITDVVFKSNPLAAMNIAGGEAKSTIGRMFGKYKNLKGKTPEAMAEDAKSIVAKIWNDKSWAQIGMNPTRASYFYDRRSGRPVVAAEEVVQIGGLVYAKNPVYTRWNDPAFEVKGYNDVDGAPIYFSVDEGEGNINNLRGAIKRTLPRFAESRDRILANPEAYYTKQSLKAIKDNLELMTEDELLENMTADGLNLIANSGGPGKGENDISVLAAVELINRKAEAGEDVSELLVQLAKVGTTVGRMLRHFAELKSATPLGIVATIEGALAKANRIMTQTQVERLTDIAERFITAQQKVKDLRDQIESEFSKKTEAELKKAAKELDKVTRELNKFTSLIVPKKTMDLLSTTIQGNLLTPISQITNVGANLFQIMTSIPVKGFETLFSKITGRFTGGTKRSFTYTLLAIPHAIKQGGIGVAEAIDTIIRGGASTEKIIHTGFLPGAAFLAAISDTKFAAMVNKTLGKEVIKGDVLARMSNGKISVNDRLKALYEGMFGVAPEVMFRFLALGDKPFSRFSEGMEAYQQAYRLGLKGDALKNYVKYPSKKQQKAIEEAGKKLTFQQDSKIATGFFGATNWLQKQGPIGQAIAFSLKLTMPYVKTPANIFVETLKFAVPGIGVASAMYNFQKKRYDQGSKDLAMAATGQMLVMVANTLIANGLVSGAFGDEDEDERALKYLKFPPMSINKSGLIRLLKGENPDYRDGDIFIRYDKFGIPGMVIGARVTSIKNNLTEAKQQEEGYYVGKNDKGWFEPFSKVFDELGVGLGTVQFLNSQSFLTGANGLLKVLSGEASEYDVEKWMENTFRSLTAIPFPNTMSAVHRSIREYMPNLRTKSIETKFRYIVMDRLFESEGIPIKIDMLGRKIPQTPEGVKSWYYNLVDFTKEHPVDDEPILNEIYRLYSLQEDADVIPGFPTKLTRIPTKHPDTGAKVTGWDPKKEEEYRQKMQKIQEVYAQNRADILRDLFASDSYNGMTNEQKQERVIETLQKYDRGYVKLPKMRGMPTIKPPMEWKKMLDELNNQYFK